MTDKALAVFENYKIRRHYDEANEVWYFSVIDIVQALIQQPDYQTARKYWNKLKERLKKEGSESVTNCHRLKLICENLHTTPEMNVGGCHLWGNGMNKQEIRND